LWLLLQLSKNQEEEEETEDEEQFACLFVLVCFS